MHHDDQMSPSQTVYVREIGEDALPPGVTMPSGKLFAVHDAISGEQLAITAGRDIAFALARKHDLTALSVH
ncbi:MAG: DUF1150 family protein [Pseudomonadota bacterium]